MRFAIAAFTDYDQLNDALLAIMGEWNSARDDTTRVQNLMDGSGRRDRLNGNVFLNDRTVHDDGDVDLLTGFAGRDWYFYQRDGSSADKVTDLKSDETETDLAAALGVSRAVTRNGGITRELF